MLIADTIHLSPCLPLSAQDPAAERETRLIWRRNRETLKLIKRFSKAVCFPLGLRFDNQTNSSLSAPSL